MSDLPMAGRPEESLLARANRLAENARLLRAVADDATEENHRAYERATEAIQRAEWAEREARLAYSAWERSLTK
jgi:hypothetical protein